MAVNLKDILEEKFPKIKCKDVSLGYRCFFHLHKHIITIKCRIRILAKQEQYAHTIIDKA